MENPDLGPDGRLQKLLEIMRSAALAGALTYISVGSNRAALKELNGSGKGTAKVPELDNPDTKIDLDAELSEPRQVVAEGEERANTRVNEEPDQKGVERETRIQGRGVRVADLLDDFQRELYDFVKKETQKLIDTPNSGLGNKKAISGAGHPELPVDEQVYWNIEGKNAVANRIGEGKPLARYSSTEFKIKDLDEYIDHLKEFYTGQHPRISLHPEMEKMIRNYIEARKGIILERAGPPGMHAEVVAVNDLFHRMDVAGLSIQDNLEKISVVTFYVQGSKNRGNHFPACTNCRNILSHPIFIITDVFKLEDLL